jgi:uncharacterized protein (TIGR02569 family)
VIGIICTSMKVPTVDITNSFGLAGIPELLPGGQNTSYLVGDVVLKPVDDISESIWMADFLSSIKEDGFRVAKPIKSVNGEWVYKGWNAYSFMLGKEVKGRALEKIDISRKFHETIKKSPRPDFIDQATHPWAIADRMVWEEIPLEYGQYLNKVMDRLLRLKKPLNIKNQLIHGDMTGNILFHDEMLPAVIDLSLYWRPAEYPTSIIAVDSIVWENASDSILDTIENSFEMNQLLVRAAMWRIKTTEEFVRRYRKGKLKDINSYHHLIDLLEIRVGKQTTHLL